MMRAINKFTNLASRPEWAFVILASIFGIFSAIVVPQLSVNDENMHFLKTYSAATGQLEHQTCTYPTDVNNEAASVYDGDLSADYSPTIDTSETKQTKCSSASAYSPFMHIPQAIGVFLANIFYPSTGTMILLGRLTNLIFFVGAMYFIIRHVKLGKWVFVVVGLLPISIHTAGSLSSDVVNNVVVLAYVAFMLNLFIQKTQLSRKQVLLLLAFSALLALTKATNALLLLPLAFLSVQLFKANVIQRMPFNMHKWGIIIACVGISIVSVLLWQHVYGAPLANPSLENPVASNPFYFLTILSNTYINPFIGYNDIVLRGVVGEFASFRYHLPTFMIVFCFVVLLISLLHKNAAEEKALKQTTPALPLIFAGTLGLLVLAVSYAMYTAWAIQPYRLGLGASYADGVQGRYFTAILVLLIPIFIWLRRFIWVETKSERSFGLLIFGACAFSLLFYAIETYRYLV